MQKKTTSVHERSFTQTKDGTIIVTSHSLARTAFTGKQQILHRYARYKMKRQGGSIG